MKRMYVTLTIIALLLAWAVTGLGQKQVTEVDDPVRRAFELREEMHKRMRDSLLRGLHFDDSIFEEMESLFEPKNLSFSTKKNFQSRWMDSQQGKTLVITPARPDQELDINIENGMITIKGKTEHRDDRVTSYSSFSNSISVPQNLDESKVRMEQKEGDILVHFPFKNVKSIQNPREERRPLPASEDALTL